MWDSATFPVLFSSVNKSLTWWCFRQWLSARLLPLKSLWKQEKFSRGRAQRILISNPGCAAGTYPSEGMGKIQKQRGWSSKSQEDPSWSSKARKRAFSPYPRRILGEAGVYQDLEKRLGEKWVPCTDSPTDLRNTPPAPPQLRSV